MLAVLPGAPKISYFTTLGLNCTILIPAPELALRSCDANTLCSRVTTSAETDSTTMSSSGIQACLSTPLIEFALISVSSRPLSLPLRLPGRQTHLGQRCRESWLGRVIRGGASLG